MKLLFVIEDRMAFRDFLCTDLVPELLRREIAVVVVTNFDPEMVRAEAPDERIAIRRWPGSKLDKRSDLYFAIAKDLYAIEFPKLTFAYRRDYEEAKNTLWHKVRNGLAGLLYRFGKRFDDLVRPTEEFGGDEAFRQILREEKPDAVAYSCCFDRIAPALREAKRLGIPLIYTVSSWDHLTTKGPLPVLPDYAFTWSEEMNREVRTYHRFNSTRPSIVGALYMDICTQPDKVLPREEFCKLHGIDPEKRIILYAMGQRRLEFLNESFIKTIHGLVAGDALDRSCHLIARANPKDKTEPYKHLEGTPGLTMQFPGKLSIFNQKSGRRLHNREDDIIRISTLYHSDLVICSTSTIVFDACLMGKPVVNIMYDTDDKVPLKYSTKRKYEFTHARAIFEEGGTWVVENEADLKTAINTCLRHPERDAEARARLLKRVISFTDGSSHLRWAEAAAAVLSQETAPARP